MRRLDAVVFCGALLLAAPAALGQVTVRTGATGRVVRVETSGQITTDGHCFGHVNPLPTGTSIIKIFGSNAVALDGNIYVSGALNFSSTTFPSGGIAVRSGGSQIASISPDGNLYAAGTCVNTSGYSNTKWDPAAWAEPPGHGGNCYTYAIDMQFPDGDRRYPGQTSTGPDIGFETNNMALRSYVDPNGVEHVGLVERLQADGLEPVGNVYPDVPTTPLGGNAHSCANGGHLVFMLADPQCYLGSPGSPCNPIPNFAYDYHFLRLDQENGNWSFKDGVGGPLVNTFNNGSPILAPLTFAANASSFPHYYANYTINVGFFCVPGGHANIH